MKPNEIALVSDGGYLSHRGLFRAGATLAALCLIVTSAERGGVRRCRRDRRGWRRQRDDDVPRMQVYHFWRSGCGRPQGEERADGHCARSLGYSGLRGRQDSGGGGRRTRL